MKPLGKLLALAALLVLSACGSGGGVFGGGGQQRPVDVSQLPSLRVVGLNVIVPRSLSVSEADSYKPTADIVWRGDPYGDRHVQVKTVVEEGITRGVSQMRGNLPVVVTVQISRFHAQTERVRYTFGGKHEIFFSLSVTNAKTGDVVIPPYVVDATFKAYGGAEALEAERNGITQKVRIHEHLAASIQRELTGVSVRPVN